MAAGIDIATEMRRMVEGALDDPRPLYAALRAEQPVYRTEHGFWYVSSYEPANSVLRNDGSWSVSPASAGVGVGGHAVGHDAHGHGGDAGAYAGSVMANSVLNLDGLDHARIRRLVSTLFTGRAADRLRSKVEESVAAQLATLDGRTEVDLVKDFAILLPTKVILDVLGIGHEHAGVFVSCADSLIAMHEPTATQDTLREADRVFRAAADVIVALAAARRADPRDDLMSSLVQVSDEAGRLSEEELVSLVVVLVVAGHETTANTLCSGLHHLLEHPDQLADLRADRSLMATAVEELLRYDGATRNSVARFAREDIELGGIVIPKGSKVYAGLQAADHDPAEFTDPLRFDIRRSPNRHIVFGGGAHYCLGAALARMELQVALNALLDRYAVIESAGAVRWRPSFIIRGLTALPLRLTPA